MPTRARAKRGDATGKSRPEESASPQAPPEYTELILTVQAATGDVVKIEKLENGQRQELSEDEYAAVAAPFAAVYGYGGAYDPMAGGYAAYATDPTAYQLAYYQGMADYAAALSASYGYAPR